MIETGRWLTFYYENLRQMHSFLKTIYNDEDYSGNVPIEFDRLIDQLDATLYAAEKIAMREYNR